MTNILKESVTKNIIPRFSVCHLEESVTNLVYGNILLEDTVMAHGFC